ncbi:MAG: baseplate J/gp47 family protein [Lachnospiraceae bacterium]|nr:baseplate J/gp47 family protein [Lachnospiraceae bacterium]
MLQIPDLDDITYEQLLENAIHKIPQLTKEWTDFNVHDPGITTLEIYTWLIDMLNYYINATGDVHTYKYMKLLGITPQECCPAAAWVFMKGEAFIPKNFPVYAGDKCFTAAKDTQIVNNSFLRLYVRRKEKMAELTDFIGKGGSFTAVFDPALENEEALYLEFAAPLLGKTDLFVTVQKQPGRSELPRDFLLSETEIFWYDGESWQKANMLQDQTNGLLKSGIMTFEIQGEMKACQEDGLSEGFYLKIAPKENHYDIAPRIGGISLNPVFMEQKENLCRRLRLTAAEGVDTYPIGEYLAADEKIAVGIRKDSADQYEILCDFNGDRDGCIRIDRTEGTLCFDREKLPKAGTRIDVFLMKEQMEKDMEIGITDGCVGQEFPLFVKNPWDTELLIGKFEEGVFVYQHWKRIEQLEKAGRRDRVFVWDEKEGVIRFGDGLHGMVPREGSLIRVSCLSISQFGEGNVRPGEIRRIYDEKYADITASNEEAAFGGRFTETLEEMQKRLEESIRAQKRLVAPCDYEQMAAKIPGLLIRKAKVMDAQEYCKNHGLTWQPYDVWLVVCPQNQNRQTVLSKEYEEAILKWLEPYRMLNTRIRAVGPSYTAVSVSGRIVIRGRKEEAKQQVEALLYEMLESLEKECCFGAVISHGDIFMRLESLPCVERVEELHLAPGGSMGHRNDRGDILLNSDCLPYAGEMNFEFVNPSIV